MVLCHRWLGEGSVNQIPSLRILMLRDHLCPESVPIRQTKNLHGSEVQILNVILKMARR